ncbi:MAG: metallophosphoesterase family protein [Saprospiraceae bacterium]|nr:metallophosphoesterase family protein [Saprospiraceae bacterium]
MRGILVLFIMLGSFVYGISQLIPGGASWKYYDLGNEPSPIMGNEWESLNYDDSSWIPGNAQLGYGDGDETTVISSSTLTGYFRKTFSVSDPSQFNYLVVDITFDDGAVVYLNGNEVARKNMPSGSIGYGTFASSNSGDNALETFSIFNDLVVGDNTIAVEVHQRNATSSDLSFDLSLTGHIPDPDFILENGGNWYYFDGGNEPVAQGTDEWEEPAYDESGWALGLTQIGYGDGDEATETASVNTVYTKKRFNVSGATGLEDLELGVTYDDGAVVYLNGSEVQRINMPSGTIEYGTYASSTSSENALDISTIPNTLVEGENVIAVEIHQKSATSSDLSFDLYLKEATLDIIRGPYLQKASDDQMTIKWRTNVPCYSSIDYGTDVNNLDNTVSDNVNKTDHEITITGLNTDTKYFYRIGTGSEILLESDSEIYFKTYPTPGADAPLTAWILGDCGTANSNQRNVRNAYYNYIGQDHTDMVLFLGDNAYNSGTDAEYQNALFNNMYESRLQNSVSWSCLGNHDGYTADSDNQTGPYYDIFTFPKMGECGGLASGTEAYYSFDYGNVHFIVLDSYETDRSIGGAMYTWCENDIQATSAKWIIALWHHPAYTKGSHDSDDESNLIQMRERFLPMLEANGVDLVLSGHSHSYERSYYINGHYGLSGTFDINTHAVGDTGEGDGRISGNGAYREPSAGPEEDKGTVYITAGSSGKISGGTLDHPAMFHSVSLLGSCVMNVTGDTLSMEFLTDAGMVNDHFTIVKCSGEEMVSNVLDAGLESLRSAINEVCSYDTVRIAETVTSPILLQSEIDINRHIIIEGVENTSIISGDGNNRIFNIGTGGALELSYLILQDGQHPTEGGALLNQGTLYLDNIILQNNFQGITPLSWTNQGAIILKSGSVNVIK